MKAYLTFTRISENDLHLLGLQNITNLSKLKNLKIISGQPILCTIENNEVSSLYLIRNDGQINQVYGHQDDLFFLKIIYDLSLINIIKYNNLKFYISNIFQTLSFEEINNNLRLMNEFENKIFYNYLHTDIKDFKKIILREILKYDCSSSVKSRLVDKLKNTRSVSKKISKKKIDIDLSGYCIYIRNILK